MKSYKVHVQEDSVGIWYLDKRFICTLSWSKLSWSTFSLHHLLPPPTSLSPLPSPSLSLTLINTPCDWGTTHDDWFVVLTFSADSLLYSCAVLCCSSLPSPHSWSTDHVTDLKTGTHITLGRQFDVLTSLSADSLIYLHSRQTVWCTHTLSRQFDILTFSADSLRYSHSRRTVWGTHILGRQFDVLTFSADSLMYSHSRRTVWYTHILGGQFDILTFSADSLIYSHSRRTVWCTPRWAVQCSAGRVLAPAAALYAARAASAQTSRSPSGIAGTAPPAGTGRWDAMLGRCLILLNTFTFFPGILLNLSTNGTVQNLQNTKLEKW